MCPTVDIIDGHFRGCVLDPYSCMLPVSEWPDRTPKHNPYASDAEWYDVVKAGHERWMFVAITEGNLFRNQFGDLVLSGAMG